MITREQLADMRQRIADLRLAANMCDDYSQYMKEMRYVQQLESQLKRLEAELEDEQKLAA